MSKNYKHSTDRTNWLYGPDGSRSVATVVRTSKSSAGKMESVSKPTAVIRDGSGTAGGSVYGSNTGSSLALQQCGNDCPDRRSGGRYSLTFLRRWDRIKALYWEENGFALLYKRLKSGSL